MMKHIKPYQNVLLENEDSWLDWLQPGLLDKENAALFIKERFMANLQERYRRLGLRWQNEILSSKVRERGSAKITISEGDAAALILSSRDLVPALSSTRAGRLSRAITALESGEFNEFIRPRERLHIYFFQIAGVKSTYSVKYDEPSSNYDVRYDRVGSAEEAEALLILSLANDLIPILRWRAERSSYGGSR